MSNRSTLDQMALAQVLIGKDPLEMTDLERDVYLAPALLDDAEKEVLRLRALIVRLAKNELSETQKAILLAE